MEEHNNPNEPVQKQNLSEWEILQLIGQNVFGMDKDKISRTVQSIIDIFDFANTYSFYLVISQIIYCSIEISPNEVDKYLNFLKEFKTFEEKNQCKYKLIDILAHFLHRKKTQESFYFLETMIREGLIKEEVVKNINNLYFAHYLSEQDYKNCQYDNYFYKNIEELQKDNWKHQKELAQEGVNPNEIVKVIRTDNIEKLQEISSQTNFNFDHQIQPSIYERCSFINQNNNALIDYAAFFGAVKCFKFLLMNDIELLSTGKYAIAGGNLEIIHLCEQNHAKFEDAYETAIEFHRNDVFHYLYENKIVEINNLEELGRKCIIHHNYDIFAFLHEIGMKINESIINEASKVGNLYLIKYFLKGNPIPKDILVFSSEIGNIELVKYILEQKGIDINSKNKFCSNFF